MGRGKLIPWAKFLLPIAIQEKIIYRGALAGFNNKEY